MITNPVNLQTQTAADATTNTLAHRRILRLPDLVRLLGRSRSGIYAALNPSSPYHEAKFPRPIRLSARCVGWRASEVFEYLDALEAVYEGGR